MSLSLLSALYLVSERDFDLIFLDIAIPLIDGLEVALRLQIIPKLHTIRLVALTGFGQNEDRTKSLLVGFDKHLTKLVIMDLLKDTFRSTANAAS